MKPKISILFYPKGSNTSKKNTVPIYLRVTVQGRRLEISTDRFIEPAQWQSGKQRVKGNSEKAQIFNAHFTNLENDVYKAVNQLELIGREINRENLRLCLKGEVNSSDSLISLFVAHNNRVAGLVNKDYAVGTSKRYTTTLDKVKAYIRHTLKSSDIALSNLDYGFISGFDVYLKTVDNLSHNTAMKYIKNLKKVIKEGILLGKIKQIPSLDLNALTSILTKVTFLLMNCVL